MSSLDDIEKLASDVVRNVDEETDDHGVGLRFDLDHEHLARAVLAMLPVVRLAEKYADADLVAPDMREAIDSLRSSMARLAGDV